MSKKILHTIAALAAALILTGGFSMTAYAGGGRNTKQKPHPHRSRRAALPLLMIFGAKTSSLSQ